MVQVWLFLRLYTKSKVQGVLNKPHYKERKMNTEFWISNTTTCCDLISPSPILISASLPRLSRRGMSSNVYLSHTPDWTTHYLTACHYSTSDWTTSAWTAQTMIGSLSISISDDVFLLFTGERSATTFIYLLLPMFLLPLTSTSEIVCMVSRRRVFDVPCLSSMRMAWGSSP